MNFIITITFAALLIGSVLRAVQANQASPNPFETTNEDGTSTGSLFLKGGPGDHWIEDANGWTVCPHSHDIEEGTGNGQNKGTRKGLRKRGLKGSGGKGKGKSKSWFYCQQKDDGDLEPRLDLPVGSSDPENTGLQKGLHKSKAKVEEACGKFCQDNRRGSKKSRLLKGLVQSHRKLQGFL